MKVGDYCQRDVVTVPATADVVEVARVMRDRHVGFLVVVEEGDPELRPIGVVTDRDIVLQICAREVDPHAVTARDIMSGDPLVARETDDLNDLMRAMQAAGYRRVPVTNEQGTLSGVIAIDDVIDVIADLLIDICGSIRNEQRVERRRRGD